VTAGSAGAATRPSESAGACVELISRDTLFLTRLSQVVVY